MRSQACWKVAVGTEVNRSHSSDSSPSGVCSSQTRITLTDKGSFLSRGACAWGQQGQLPKGQLNVRGTGFVPMPCGHLKRTTRLARPRPCALQRGGNLFFDVPGTPILSRSYQKVRPGGLTGVCRRE